MNIFIILLFYSSLSSSFCLETYYNNIDLAESSIFNENWDSAAVYYELAFTMSSDPFTTDVINYLNVLILSEEEKKDNKMYYWVDYLLNKRGVGWHFVEKWIHCDSLLSKFKENCTSGRMGKNQKSLNDSIFYQIFLDDQSIRPSGIRSSKDKFAIDSMDQINWNRFNKFIDDFGFPSERNLSYTIDDKQVWMIVSLLLRHFIQRGYGEEVIHILNKEFSEFIIPRNIIASVYDLEYSMSRGKKEEYNLVTTYLVFVEDSVYKPLIDYSYENIQRINKRRGSVFLPNLDVSIQKVVCSSMCKDGIIKKFIIEPYVSFDELPGILFAAEDQKAFLKERKIDFNNFNDGCPCTTF